MKRTYAITLAAALLLAGGCASSSKQETAGQYLDDSGITTRVKKAIFDEPSLKVTQISVETWKSVVQLSGFVDTSAQVGTAGSLARAVAGVTSVKNDIRVKQ
jgi:osmotically-inducible protein OsmY